MRPRPPSSPPLGPRALAPLAFQILLLLAALTTTSSYECGDAFPASYPSVRNQLTSISQQLPRPHPCSPITSAWYQQQLADAQTQFAALSASAARVARELLVVVGDVSKLVDSMNTTNDPAVLCNLMKQSLQLSSKQHSLHGRLQSFKTTVSTQLDKAFHTFMPVFSKAHIDQAVSHQRNLTWCPLSKYPGECPPDVAGNCMGSLHGDPALELEWNRHLKRCGKVVATHGFWCYLTYNVDDYDGLPAEDWLDLCQSGGMPDDNLDFSDTKVKLSLVSSELSEFLVE